MSTRRSIITRLPAALALAVLPSRLTQRVQAQEAALVSEWVDVPGVEAWANYSPLPLMSAAGPEIVSMPKPAFRMTVPTKADQDRDILEYVDRCIKIADWAGGHSHMMHSNGDPGYDHIAIMTPDGEVHALPGDTIVNVGDWFRVVGRD